MDLWTEELSRVDEQLSRKWKNLESKFDLLIPTIESKMENKLTLIQRDNRRHSESFSGMIIGLGQRVELSNERIATSISTWVSKALFRICGIIAIRTLINFSVCFHRSIPVMSRNVKLVRIYPNIYPIITTTRAC